MRAALSITALGAVILGACATGTASGSGTSGAAASGQTRKIEIEMKGGFSFAPKALMLKAGERVVIAFKNSDTVEHEFMAGRRPTGSVGYKEDLLAEVKPEVVSPSAHDASHGGGHAATGVGIRLQPGQAGTVSFVVPDKVGEHEFGCFVAGHHESGMKGKLTIAR